MTAGIAVEISWSQPVGTTVHFTIDEVREAGIDVTDYEAVEAWAEAEAIKLVKNGDEQPSDWDTNDFELIDVGVMGADFDLDDFTPEELARIPEDQR
jgi:hypothetical protein